jgi:hypothetical protein
VAATAGAVGGAYVGGSLDNHYGEFIPAGTAIGVLAGEAILMPIGVHLGNARRGRLLPDVAVSFLGAVTALGIGALTQRSAGYVAGAGIQIGLTVWAERDGARQKAREAEEAARRARGGMQVMPAPPPEPEPMVPPPPPVK